MFSPKVTLHHKTLFLSFKVFFTIKNYPFSFLLTFIHFIHLLVITRCHRLPGWIKNPPIHLQCRRHRPMQTRSLSREDPLEEGMATHSVFLPGESHGQRSPVGYSPWSCKELDMTEEIEPAGMH